MNEETGGSQNYFYFLMISQTVELKTAFIIVNLLKSYKYDLYYIYI